MKPMEFVQRTKSNFHRIVLKWVPFKYCFSSRWLKCFCRKNVQKKQNPFWVCNHQLLFLLASEKLRKSSVEPLIYILNDDLLIILCIRNAYFFDIFSKQSRSTQWSKFFFLSFLIAYFFFFLGIVLLLLTFPFKFSLLLYFGYVAITLKM